MAWIPPVCLFLSFFGLGFSQTSKTLHISKGDIIGLQLSANPATSNVSYDAYIGIPYAQKPVRFQLPVPPAPWTSPKTTQQDGPACPQPGMAFDEDCLYLNVFTPPDASGFATKLPVMAFIHGSAFTGSSSNSKRFGPDFLVTGNVILVTMNYRLGAAGFLALGSPVAPGNLGLHDTLLALQWIQDEISVFGGDPTKVTLFGQSAGSVMTQFHYLSPLSTGMFRSVIAQSGSALAKWGLVTSTEATRRAQLLATAVGCGGTPQNDTATLACLQAVDINYIVGNQSIILPLDNRVNGDGLPFVPVMDSQSTSNRPFFSNDLESLMVAAVGRAKPMISGFTTDEGILMFVFNYWKEAEANLGAFTNLTGDLRTALAANISKQYFPVSADQNKVKQLVSLYTDYMFAYPALQVARYFANLTYGYVFAYDGSWASLPAYFSNYGLRGVNHGDDLDYLFYQTGGSQSLQSCTVNENNINIKNLMVKRWTDFATNGVPDASWPKVSTGNYWRIDTTPSIVNSSQVEGRYYSFWAAIDQTKSPANTIKVPIFTLFTSVLLLLPLYM